MSAWITITIDDLNDARAAKLIDALRTKALADGQTDPMPRIVAMVAGELRDSIAFGGRALSQTPDTVPAGLKDLAVQKVIRAMKGRLLQALTKDETEAEALYQRRLEQLNRGEWPVEAPDDAETTPPVPPAQGYYGGNTAIPI